MGQNSTAETFHKHHYDYEGTKSAQNTLGKQIHMTVLYYLRTVIEEKKEFSELNITKDYPWNCDGAKTKYCKGSGFPPGRLPAPPPD